MTWSRLEDAVVPVAAEELSGYDGHHERCGLTGRTEPSPASSSRTAELEVADGWSRCLA